MPLSSVAYFCTTQLLFITISHTLASNSRKGLKPSNNPAIPGGRPNPVTTLISPLAFRKHGCDNMPLKETIERLDDLMSGGCNVHRGTERTQASVCRCPLPFGSKQLCQHHGCSGRRGGDSLTRCADVGIRHVFAQIAFPAGF